MPLYPVLYIEGNTTVGQFLRGIGFQSKIQNPNVRIPQLIGCKGVVHYQRSGTRTVVTQENYPLQNGDFLFVADQCSSGKNQVLINVSSNDYAFIMGSGDDFYEAAENYMNRRPGTRSITANRSLEEILRTLSRGRDITAPIGNVIIVSHAREEGMLHLKLNTQDLEERVYLEKLCPFVKNLEPYVENQARTQITQRIIRNHANTIINIRGCNIGRKIEYLRFIKQIFGNQVTVTAPKHIDNFLDFTIGSGTPQEISLHCEFMSYCFTVRKKTRAKDQNEVIRLFFDKQFMDIHDNQLTGDELKAWIPKNIHQESFTQVHGCKNPIDEEFMEKQKLYTRDQSMGVKYIFREYRGRYERIYEWGISIDESEKPPQKETEKIELLRREIKRAEREKAEEEEKKKKDRKKGEKSPREQCPYPFCTRWGFNNIDDFVDNLHWDFIWNLKKRILWCKGSRYAYELRIPITDAQKMLILNAVYGSGNRRYLHNKIVETDTKFFASV